MGSAYLGKQIAPFADSIRRNWTTQLLKEQVRGWRVDFIMLQSMAVRQP